MNQITIGPPISAKLASRCGGSPFHGRWTSLRVVTKFEDIETAKRSGRSDFEEMVAFLKRHHSCRVILVEKTDRFYRNIKDWIRIDELGVDIHFAKENVVIGPDSRSSDKFLHGIKVLMAKNYIENLSEEVRKGMLEKGYATGRYSLKAVTARASAEGLTNNLSGRPLARSQIHSILQNPIYCGDFRWLGKLYVGKHEPLVPRSLFADVQRVLASANRPRYGKHRHAFAGLVTCGRCAYATCRRTGPIAQNCAFELRVRSRKSKPFIR
jgi:site-specific DNA recombinase